MSHPTGEELLKYVEKGEIANATEALAKGADVDFRDPATGNTALHLAVINKSETLVKLMIIFDADLTIKNNQNKTALDLAEEEEDAAIALVINMILGLKDRLNADHKPKAKQSSERSPNEAFLLSLDGGGIRGLVFLQAMVQMENRREIRYPGSKPLLSQFNWVTGNSAGGISALLLADPKVTAKHGRQLFFTVKDHVEPPILTDQLDLVFQTVYEKVYSNPSAMMSDIKGRNVSVMTTLCKECPAQLHIMSNYKGVQRIEGTEPPEKQLIWKAARATSSLPIVIKPEDNMYIDGGLIANNPTTDAIIDMYEYAEQEKIDLKLKLVLSFGTGLHKAEPIDDVDFEPSEPGTLFAKLANFFGQEETGEEVDMILKVAKNPKALINLLKIVSSQITQPNGQVLKRGEFLSKQVGAKYYRINPTIKAVDAMTTDDTPLIEMLYSVTKYMLENCNELTDPILDYIYGE